MFRTEWEDISFASWLKYPCKERPDVLSFDLIDKHFNPETGVLKTTRVGIFDGSLPKWVSNIVGGSVCMFIEHGVVDPKNKFMQLVGKNITCNNFLEVEEICTYTPVENDPKKYLIFFIFKMIFLF